MPVAMAEPIFKTAAALFDQPIHFAEHPVGIFRVETLDPELLVVAHLPWRIAHDRIQVLAHEGAGIVAGDLRRIDDGGTRADQGLKVVHDRHALAERLLGPFAIGDVGPRANDLRGTTLAVAHDVKGVLDPDVVPVAVAETIFDCSSALFYQGRHFSKDALGVLRMQPHGPEVLVLEHLPG